MAKRFTDTGKWDKAWFRKLPPRLKCAWDFLLSKCDHAGIWDIDLEAMSFNIGENVTLGELTSAFEIEVDGDKLFIPGFIEFQYNCKVSDLNPSNKVHASVLQRLKKLTPSKPLPSPMQGAKDKEKDKDKDQEKDQVGGVGEFVAPTLVANPSALSAEVREASVAWSECLIKHGSERAIFPWEHTELARNIQSRGIEAVQLAILGQKYEPESAEFKPSRHLSLKRLFDPQKFDRFVNLGAQARKKLSEREAEQARLTEMQSVAQEPAPDPAEVRKYLDGLFGKMPKESA